MKILHVLGESVGGIRQHVASLKRELDENAIESAIAGPSNVMKGLCEQEVVLKKPSLKKPWNILNAVKEISRQRKAYDVIHAHGLTAATLVLLANFGGGAKPVVVTLHNVVDPTVTGKKFKIMKAIETKVVKRADHVICPSKFALAQLKNYKSSGSLGEKTSVILPVGRSMSDQDVKVAIKDASSSREKFGISPTTGLVVCVARYSPQKDLPTLINAFSKVVEEIADAKLLIAGSGSEDYRSNLQFQIDTLGLNNSIELVGYLDNPNALIAAANVTVISSRFETVPLVLLESLLLGTPVVMTNVGIASEILEEQSGKVVDVGNARSLADALIEWLQFCDTNAVDEQQLMKTARSFTDTDKIITPLLAVYKALMDH